MQTDDTLYNPMLRAFPVKKVFLRPCNKLNQQKIAMAIITKATKNVTMLEKSNCKTKIFNCVRQQLY